MPPVNSPVEEGRRLGPSNISSLATTRTPSPNSLLPSLSHLNSSVPDLASTLTLHSSADPSDDAEMENLSFLRHPAATEDPPPHHRISSVSSLNRDAREANRRRREALQHRERSLSDEAREQRRLRDRHLRQNFDNHDVWVESLRNRTAQGGPPRIVPFSELERREPYGEAAPNRQTLYDWAPATEEGDEDELEEILIELREQQPNTHPDILRVLGRNQFEARLAALGERTRRAEATLAGRASNEEGGTVHQSSLRTAAILSSVRRNRQLSARSRDLMQRYVMDRERVDRERASNEGDSEERDRSGGSSTMWFRMAQQANDQHSNRYELNRLAWQANQRPSSSTNPSTTATASAESSSSATNTHANRPADTLETLRRRYLEDPHAHAHEPPNPVEAFKSAIEFIDTVSSLDESDPDPYALRKLVQQQQQRYERPKLPSIDLPTASLLSYGFPPPPCSFLRPGMVFFGYQQAAPQITAVTTASANSHPTPDSGSTSATNTTTIYRLPNGQGFVNGPIDPAAAAAARAVWSGSRDGSRSSGVQTSNSGSSSAISSLLRTRDASHCPYSPPGQDRWAVRVAIHAVDYERMTLQGTMEAFNMPSGNPHQPYPTSAERSTQRSSSRLQPPSGSTTTRAPGTDTSSTTPKTTTFSTYLTGELIDLSKHTLRTTNALYPAKAESEDDAKYWKRLEPFASAVKDSAKDQRYVDDDVALAAHALDARWLDEEWREKYVLMRWKERCFVKPTCISPSAVRGPSEASSRSRSDEGDLRNISGEREIRSRDGTAASTPSFGLSIKGFYYVSLRRSDGRIEGLYFDPQSSPYQRLEMEVDRAAGAGSGGGGGWEFA